MHRESLIFQHLCDHARRTAVLESVQGLLNWDQQTKLPPSGAAYRAEQITFLAGEAHRHKTDPRVGQWLESLEASQLAAENHSDTGATIRQLKREYDKAIKLPADLVQAIARCSSLGQQAWQQARRDDDFSLFAPYLKEMIQLKRQQAQAVGFQQHCYDALLDDFEPGETTADVARVLAELKNQLIPLVEAIAGAATQSGADPSILRRDFPCAVQEALARDVAARIGFDFGRGRLDTAAHPFCSAVGPDDCRLTTRYDPRYFSSAFFGTLHEAGHGLYEQGLRADQFGLPPGRYCSLAIHESQSRMWENLVGRSRSFWTFFFPLVQQRFPSLRTVSADQFYGAVNHVQPSLIRVEADEATYNLHILIRFELELALLDDQLPVKQLPATWNEKYCQYLGIRPESDANGVLQDIHWSCGLIGYFPTYALGNLYACQFYAQAAADLGDLDTEFSRGRFSSLGDWLRENIHHPGSCYLARELVEKVTGRALSHQPLIDHLRLKMGAIYGL